MEAKAVARYVRMSPRKVRLVADMVRGKSVGSALNVLHFTQKRGALPVEKLLRSAVANMMNKEEASKLEPEDLFVKTIFVDQGPMMKRFRPRAMGRATMIRKRFSHITIIVSDVPAKE